MSSDHGLLYRLGYALERARARPAATKERLPGLAERRKERAVERPAPREAWPEADALMLSGAAVAISRVLDAWKPRARPGTIRLLRAAAAGAGAALLVDLVRPLLRGRAELPALGRDTADHLLVGASQGLLYGAAVEPRVPGPAALKGAVYGSVEYAVDPVGGLGRLLGAHAPYRRLPVLADLLEGLTPHDRAYLEHVLFGVTLATLYGSSPSSNGIRADDEEGE